MSNHCLNMKAAFGYNHDLTGAVHSLFDETREAVLFPSSHTLIYHDCRTGQQKFLQGHANTISAVAVSNDKKWIVSADYGAQDTLVIIWDCKTLLPVRTYSNNFGAGVTRIDLSDDGALIAILTGTVQDQLQELQIYEWASPSEEPIVSGQIPQKYGFQRDIRFNPSDYREIVTNSAFRTVFWTWSETIIEKQLTQTLAIHAPDIQSGEFKVLPSAFTVSCFLPNTTAALTATVAGEVVLYDVSGRAFTKTDAKNRIPIKLLVLHTASGNSKPIMPSDEINQKNEQILLESAFQTGEFGESSYMVPGQHFYNSIAQNDQQQIQLSFYRYLTAANIASQQMTGSATQSFTQAITYMHAKADGFIVTGGLDGAVRMFDFRLRLLSWYENLESGPITSISIAMPQVSSGAMDQIDMSTAAVQLMPGQTPRDFQSKSEALNAKFGSVVLRDFICSTSRGSIILVPAAVFEFIQPEKRKGTLLYQGIPGDVKCMHIPKSMQTLPIQQSFNVKTGQSQPLIWLANSRGDLLIYDFTSNKILRSNNVVGEILNTGNVSKRLSGTLAQRHAEGYEQASFLVPVHPLASIKSQTYPHITSMNLFSGAGSKPVLLAGTSLGSALLLDPFNLQVLQSFRNVARNRRVMTRIAQKDFFVDDWPYKIKHVKFSREGDIIAIIDESSQLKLLAKTQVQDQKMNYMTGKTDILQQEVQNNIAEFSTIFNDNFVEPLKQPPKFVSDLEEAENNNDDEVEKRTETDVRIHPAAQLARQNQKKRDAASSAGQWDPLGNNLLITKDPIDAVFSCEFLPFQLFNEIENLPLTNQKRDPLVILSKDRFYTIIDIDATLTLTSRIVVYRRFKSDSEATPTAMCFLPRPLFYLDQLNTDEFQSQISEIEAEPDDLKREIKKSLISLQSQNKGYLNATIRPELQPIDQRDLIIIANNQFKLQLREPKRLPGAMELSNNTVFTQVQLTSNPVTTSHFQGGYPTNQPPLTQDKFSTNSSYYVNPRLAGPFPLRRTVVGPTFAREINLMSSINNEFSDFRNDINSCQAIEQIDENGEMSKKFRYRTRYEILNSTGSVKHIPQYVVFQTPDKVIGMMRTPFDGAPHRYVGLIAHAGELLQTEICYCFQQQLNAGNTYTVSAGKTDSTVFLWQIDYSCMDLLVDSAVAAESNEYNVFEPFLNQLEGGMSGDYYQEIQEYFSYAQIYDSEEKGLSPSENARAPVGMIGDMLRALGVYISNEHVNSAVCDIIEEEVRYKRLQFFLQSVRLAVNEQKPVFLVETRDGAPAFYQGEDNIYVYFKDVITGQISNLLQEENPDKIEKYETFEGSLWEMVGTNEITLSLSDFVRILVNYRFVQAQSYDDIVSAFSILAGEQNAVIDRNTLLNKFYSLAEQFNAGELTDCLGLMSGKVIKQGVLSAAQVLPDQISADDIAIGLLGFPEPGADEKGV
ncbi:putative flagellar associated protein [Spironucleus salmonicida]|uniref:Cilia- and flagella-associated protein 251 n=1 Tax=Spironucleus salmonicida TaxID=348837 RepID=V6M1D9_9EUKA|nr:putative flagellar associated protein [Spironucleus salmonicida]|eukprot:EST46999.1 Putative flagellar associated protein [Spironucleus salmonicida]